VALRVGSLNQLFVDDRLIETSVACHRQLHRPTRFAGNPVIRPERPWEVGTGNNGVYNFGGTVIFDQEEGVYKMWYRSSEGRPDLPYRSCYATSTDGFNWTKPELGLSEYVGSKRTNILPPGSGGKGFVRRPNLIKDYEDLNPARRYKMAYVDDVDGRWLLQKAYSRDGIHWDMESTPGVLFEPQPPYYPLGVLMGWDPMRRVFVHFHRKARPEGLRADVDGRTLRAEAALAMSTSADFDRWGDTIDIHLRDDKTDPPHWDIGHAGVLAATPYTGDLYVGFLDTASTPHVEDVDEGHWPIIRGEHDEHRSELVISRDGERWTRVASHWDFLRRGLPWTWDSEFVVLSKPIVREDDILIYYTGRNLTCGVQQAGHPQFELLGQTINGLRMGYSIGVATLRRDGFASIDGYDPAGTLTTPLLIFDGDHLVVNVRAPAHQFAATEGLGPGLATRPSPAVAVNSGDDTPFGRMAVELLDETGRPIAGYSLDACDGFTGDAIRHRVTWNGRSDVGRLAGRKVRLRFRLRNAALYAFQFRGEGKTDAAINLLCPGGRGHPA
jgi:hypothetical protein